ncbi:recombination-associated protein RdgC, partial [Neisseria flavescens]|uniref:recombination-associated protein RdgC n=1 Tax=Neisseria flavescens TaxID=484 RepID=UPI000B214CD2
MWFKQVTPFRVFELLEAKRLKTAIAENWFCSPTGLDWFSEGFCSPVPFGNPIIFEAQKTMLISLMREEKVLPSAAIKHKLDEQVVKIQTAEGRNVGRREKHELREAI